MLLKLWQFLGKFLFGARIIKTAIAIVSSIYLATLFGLDSTLTAIGATFAVEQTAYRSYLSLLEQVLANLFGAIVAVIIVLNFGVTPLSMGLAVIFTIWCANKLKKANYIGIALVTLIVIMETQSGSFVPFALRRLITLSLGVSVAFFVNVIILPPKYEKKLLKKIKAHSDELIDKLGKKINFATSSEVSKKTLDALQKDYITAEHTYQLFKEERHFFKKNACNKARKLVLYRSMLSTMRASYTVLKKFHNITGNFKMMPDDFQEKMIKQLSILIEKHCFIFDNFDACLSSKKVLETTNISELVQLLAELKSLKIQDDRTILRITSLTSAIFEYGECLEHLQAIHHSQRNFH